MNSNHHYSSPNPLVPSRQCAAYADLLPVLDEPETEASAAAEVRTHLATCAYCQDRLRQYAQLDATIARAVGPAATPRRSTEDIMRDILHDDTTQAATTPIALAAPTPVASDPARPRGPLLRHPPLGSRRRWSGIASLAAVLAVALLAAILFGGHGRGGVRGAKATPAPDWSGPGSQTSLESISMVSSTEGWAIGSAFPANGTNGNQARVLLMHYKYGVWSSIRLAISGQVNSISMVSANDGWAVGGNGLMLHYNGTTWRQVASPTRNGFTQVQMLSATDGWAVGGAPGQGRLFHYDGHAWTGQSLGVKSGAANLASLSLSDLDMLSPMDGWAIGAVATAGPGTPVVSNNSALPKPTTTVILRYHAGTWTVDDTLTNAGSEHYSLAAIAMTSADDGWAVGIVETGSPGTSTTPRTGLFLFHHTNGVWHRVADPLAGTSIKASGQISGIMQLAMRTEDDGWIVVSSVLSSMVGNPAVALHYDGTHWSVVALPSIPHSADWYLTSLTFTPAGDLWAIGGLLSDATTSEPDGHGGFMPTITPLILHEQHGTWSVVMP